MAAIVHDGGGGGGQGTEKIFILEHHRVGGLPKYERENFINNHRPPYP